MERASSATETECHEATLPGYSEEWRHCRQWLYKLYCYTTWMRVAAAPRHLQERLHAIASAEDMDPCGEGRGAVASQQHEDVAGTLASAIYGPRESPLEGPDTPALLWRVVGFAVGISLMVAAFFAAASIGLQSFHQMEKPGECQISATNGPDEWMFGSMKMIMVVSVSAVSSGIFNIKGVTWPTMLLGV
mmetsp:Transcript_5712/g.13676  ORF Transcript_5712/g.13676 Transcript_5712/m.13676 type:complete len:190 (+) Transcript_5712:91-660(+)